MSGRQPWGFHRLGSDWADRIVEGAGVRRGDLVVDVGAGLGALTDPLLSIGARVIAIELHAGRADRLRRRLADEPAATVLTMDLRDFSWPGRPLRVVANPPFAILPELIAALRRHPTLRSADLVVPRTVMRRHVTRNRSRHLVVRPGLDLPRSAFSPRPPMVCGVLQLRRS